MRDVKHIKRTALLALSPLAVMMLMFLLSPGYAHFGFTHPAARVMLFIEMFWIGLGCACLYAAHRWWKRALLFCVFPLPAMILVLMTTAVVELINNYGSTEEQTSRFFNGQSKILYGVDIPHQTVPGRP
ncbi:hypothetical protein KF728_21425 [Candidatus Obscuribacterales bacterium]|nr:hypothetical protein [Candidatus Obscuribacterales bacterium]MBX3152733.1 hypothetical protein [Candidatus Obscuribacterales bacterium]